MFMQGKNLPGRQDRAAVGSSGTAFGTPLSIVARFGNPKARPKVVQVYNPRIGWSALAKRIPLTEDFMAELRTSGATMVDARWRSHRHRIALEGPSLPTSAS
jgi:hypothetical protein